MDQQKIGGFLKELRKEKGITQEQFAEELNVSGRTVSRWETGSNMPDISLLVAISDFFDVSIPEIINGERKSETMNEETRETAEKMSDYAGAEKAQLLERVRVISIVGLLTLLVGLAMGLSHSALRVPVYAYVRGMCLGVSIGALITMVLYTTGVLSMLMDKKSERPGYVKAIAVSCSVVVALLFLASVVMSII